jgi:hypothetical protein
MADLKDKLVKVNDVILSKEVADAFASLQTFVSSKKSETLTIKPNGGYMSKYRLVEELAKLVKVGPNTPPAIKALIDKARVPEDFVTLARNSADFASLQGYLDGLTKADFTGTPETYVKYKVLRDKHPYIADGELYGVPNKTTVDPRRTGNFIMIDVKSDSMFLFLKENAPDYGFVWYGIDKSYWVYQGQSVKDIAVQIKNNITEAIKGAVNFLTDIFE